MNRNTANMWLGLIRVLVIVAIPMPAFAQALESLTTGAKVRVRTVSPDEWRVGYIRSIDSSGISATTTSSGGNMARAAEATYSWTLPLASVSRVEVSRGPGERAGRTIVGALLGGLGGGLLVGAVGAMATQCSNCDSPGIGVVLGPIFGVPIGLVVGGIVGFATARERWEPVSVRAIRP